MAKTSLVIVESPAKAKTIGKYLGPGYKVTASMGHLRDLPKSTMGVDIEHGFEPDYQPIKGREELIEQLKNDAKKSGHVYLATDPDREGEAISWHLKELLELTDKDALRVTFNEITKNVVSESIKTPRPIDMDLVDAQQARRILDRIVGYKLSPLLWKKIRRGLSAGRVQSVATRIVVDREEEIRAFVPEEYWLLDAILGCGDKKSTLSARYYGYMGKKKELKNEKETDAVISAVTDSPFTVGSVKRTTKQRTPSAPFITSTLQQEASRRLNMTPRRTMSIAQQLYEGMDITGEGTVGLITYMRTDSLRISEEAIAAAKSFIVGRYGPEYYPTTSRRFKSKSNAQDAHEAIRPSNVMLTPETIRKDLTSEQYRLYRLVWSRFVASQMAAAVYDSMTVDAVSAGHIFRSSYSSLKFAGYTAVYDDGREEEGESKKKMPELTEGQNLDLQKLDKEQKFTQPPSRYTEDTLIKAMEEKGIGRPSTYAPTVSTILSREYVVKEGKFLRSTPLGEVVTGLMEERFPDIVDVKFTANMEEKLDCVEEGKTNWKVILEDFYRGFDQSMEDAEKALDGERIKVPDEVTDEICDVCGKQMVIKSGRFGRFLGCQGYPDCTFTKPLVIEMPGKCPRCGSRILKRSSKKGYTYYACERLKECGFMTWDVPTKDSCAECGHTMFKRSGRGASKPFCINEECSLFLPEDKRGYKRKPKTEDGTENAAMVVETEKAVDEAPAKKTVKKTTGEKTAKKTDEKATKKAVKK